MTPSTDTITSTTAGTFDLTTTYVVARHDGAVPRIPIDDSFWPEVAAGGHPELDEGWMVSAFDYTSDWDSWERHPRGDEVVTLLGGRLEMVLDLDGREWTVALDAGRTVIV